MCKHAGRAVAYVLFCAAPIGPASSATFSFHAVFTPTAGFPFGELMVNPHARGDTSNLPNFDAGLSHGDTIHGSFSYDLLAPDNAPRPGFGRFIGQGVSLLLPSGALLSSSSGIVITGSVGDGAPADGEHRFSISSPIVSLPAPVGHAIGYSFGISAFGVPFDPSSLPTEFSLADLGLAYAVVLVTDGLTTPINPGEEFGSRSYFFALTQIAQVSEIPILPSLPLFAAGLGVMGLLGWRRKK